MPRQMWKKARIDELLQGRDSQIWTANLRLPDRTKIQSSRAAGHPTGD